MAQTRILFVITGSSKFKMTRWKLLYICFFLDKLATTFQRICIFSGQRKSMVQRVYCSIQLVVSRHYYFWLGDIAISYIELAYLENLGTPVSNAYVYWKI